MGVGATSLFFKNSYSIGQKNKPTYIVKKFNNFFFFSGNFNETLLVETLIGSDYFFFISVVKVPLVVDKSLGYQIKAKKIQINFLFFTISENFLLENHDTSLQLMKFLTIN